MPEDLAQKLEASVVAARRVVAKDQTLSEELRADQEADAEQEERRKR